MKNIKKVLIILGIIISIISLNFLSIINSVHAAHIDTANMYSIGECGNLLKYKGVVVLVHYIEYKANGNTYPAYCLDKNLPGVTDGFSYSVSVQDAITDVAIWRTLINGYPYKSISELGCQTKQEAFTATKQALYCYIHGNNPNDYEAIGEAGQRTLNALKKIVSDAQNSKETKISNNISINKSSSSWIQDNIDKEYVSKTYLVSAGANITNYKIKLSKGETGLPDGIKLTDENNKEKSEFSPNEKFKILIPIKNLRQEGSFKINAEAKIKTKPVLYGKAPNASYQDYALTAATYEDAIGVVEDSYNKNNTKITAIKVDKDTKNKLKGVEFELLNEDKKVIHSNLVTDKEGKIVIDNLLPGKYYLKEVKTLDGYTLYEKLIEVTAKLNQSVTVTVNNSKEEIVEVKTEEKQLEVEQESSKKISVQEEKTTEIRKLPVTGM